MSKDMCSAVISDDGVIEIITPKGELIKYVMSTEIEQDTGLSFDGKAIVNLRLWVNTKKPPSES